MPYLFDLMNTRAAMELDQQFAIEGYFLKNDQQIVLE